ncbi:MAG: type II secretion system protein GspG [Robiginitomaculum sp.]|nr:MAG: type II secretion system protein GspG [Robiginitomaculum sp.]
MSKENQTTPKDDCKKRDGYTLTELLVVLVILGLLVGLIAPRFLGQIGKARSKTARVQISNLSTALEYYQLDTGRYPTASTGLSALLSAPPNTPNWDGPYLKTRRVPDDPWGNPYIYQPGVGGDFVLKTLGADQREGGDGENTDISSADL